MSKTIHFVRTTAVALAVALGFAAAAHAADAKIAVFDAQMVINGTNAAKRAVKDLTAKRDAAQAQINALEKPLIAKQQKLREQQSVLSADKFQDEQKAFAKDLADFRAKASDIQSGLDEENLKFRKQITEAVRKIVEQIAKEKGYEVILPKGITFYTAPDVPDISDDVLARANKALDKK